MSRKDAAPERGRPSFRVQISVRTLTLRLSHFVRQPSRSRPDVPHARSARVGLRQETLTFSGYSHILRTLSHSVRKFQILSGPRTATSTSEHREPSVQRRDRRTTPITNEHLSTVAYHAIVTHSPVTINSVPFMCRITSAWDPHRAQTNDHPHPTSDPGRLA